MTTFFKILSLPNESSQDSQAHFFFSLSFKYSGLFSLLIFLIFSFLWYLKDLNHLGSLCSLFYLVIRSHRFLTYLRTVTQALEKLLVIWIQNLLRGLLLNNFTPIFNSFIQLIRLSNILNYRQRTNTIKLKSLLISYIKYYHLLVSGCDNFLRYYFLALFKWNSFICL